MKSGFSKCLLLVTLIPILGCSQKDDLSSSIELQRVILFSAVPLDYRYLSQEVGGKCNLERITKELNGDYTLIGWAIPSERAEKVARTYMVGVETKKSIRFGLARKQERSDVADYFKNKKLLESGFFARFKQSDLPRGACVSAYQIYDKTILKCKNNVLFEEGGIKSCP
jgi:hypothetical protein